MFIFSVRTQAVKPRLCLRVIMSLVIELRTVITVHYRYCKFDIKAGDRAAQKYTVRPYGPDFFCYFF